MFDLNDKVAIVTGASSGIGRATALLLARSGATVVLNARRAGPLEETMQAIRADGGRALAVAGDIADPATHDKLVAAARECGGLDIAVNNAGTAGPYRPLAEVSLDEWHDVLAINLTGAFLGARSQIPAMLERGGGALVFTSTFVGTSAGVPGMAAYGASKAALMGLVKGITADYAAHGIRANAVLPGGVDTPMGGDAAQKEWAAGLHALKRIARPDEIAAAIGFLVSPLASFVAGTGLFADGGNAAVK
ncbi:NADP-dependent 3-hydroxy acid dehydrogenase YdfG [Pseudoduganella flava]|uniref:NADP-dependent 3-hydroxy acid dehydrogenase YdfG n=1 Tax=Pseudoduganella flava TaxID=871742 RepID=A0A562Q114_9BURK|nr:SDR family oxidoreductase [Pseudoduganella flava]QGZ38116.1 SDR family oxidoreductase [Pseudoduganella flava]TWI50369.1 NADP-dependent 3-hydroxy acid dehydrogenase YdfG [Pseudoduganella flava]